jgi:hypothetical protein
MSGPPIAVAPVPPMNLHIACIGRRFFGKLMPAKRIEADTVSDKHKFPMPRVRQFAPGLAPV